MVLRLLFLVALLSTTAGVNAQAIDPAQSEIRFVSRQMNVPIEGRFAEISGDVHFDPAHPEAARAEIVIALRSIDAGSEDATTEVRRKSWLNIDAFPTAKFVANGVKPLGGDRYQARGELGIKSISRELVVPFSVRRAGNATVFEGRFTLLRLAFNIGEGLWSDTDTVANEVEVSFRLVRPDEQ